MKKTMTTVAIVEDDARFRRSLQRVIESSSDLTCVATCGTGAEALKAVPASRPDIVIMDLNLPDRTGAQITASLKQELPDLSVIVLTVYNDAENIFGALRAGACGYLLKQASAQEILEAIETARTGGAPMTNEIARKVLAAFREPAPEPEAGESLAPREREILELVARGYANKEIADKLSLSVGTVCWYLHEVYRKLHVQSRTQAVNKLRKLRPGPSAPHVD